uniref:Beta-microseminoprotein n=1 Tax=Anabas testudineus TaxID=64144 RepID=A0A3Q1JER7_ANATE
MASLHVFVCLLGLVVLCHSTCFLQTLKVKDPKNPSKGCVDQDGKQHDFGSEWVRDCMSCSCTSEGLRCCDMILPVRGPEECKVVVNRETCTVNLVLRSDKTKDCFPV